MKSKVSFLELKNETAQYILALQDEAVLAKVRAILWDGQATQEDMNAIERSREACKTGKFSTMEDFLQEIETL